jgi:CheY-like chemotaxis protein
MTDSGVLADVLLVDDEVELSTAVEQILEMEGFSVVRVQEARAALSLLEHGLRPSLVILDLSMPVMDGWELCRALQSDAALREIPIAVCTGMVVGKKTVLPPRAADAGFLEKPLDLDRLLALVRSRCAPRAGSSPEPACAALEPLSTAKPH